MSDRIKLAEAMGWNRAEGRSDNLEWSGMWFSPDGYGPRPPPDPFTDANDDYRVLVWAIKNIDPDAYFAALTEVVGSYCYMHEYRIGYFARAALKVIE